jgi:hypothetical protein
VVLDCPQPAGWSTGVDAKTADVSEAGHEPADLLTPFP